MRILLVLLAILPFTISGIAQRNPYVNDQRSNEGFTLLMNFSYGVHLPGADLADRFGSHFSAGGHVEFLLKNNLIMGLQSHFSFGPTVKQDVLSNLRNEDGFIFGNDGSPANVNLRQRGIYMGAHIGKLFPVSARNKRSGIRFTLGAGLLQHKIRIQDDPQVAVALLNEEYKKGYDRLTNGFALTEFIGYQFMSLNRRINFLAGFEFSQGFTESRRSFNFDTRSSDTSRRLDLVYGFRIGWTLPLFLGEQEEEIRY